MQAEIVTKASYHAPYQTENEREAETAKIAAIALLAIAFFVSGCGIILMAFSRLPANFTLGLGILPYTFGVSLNFLAMGLLITATACAAMSVYYHVKQMAEEASQ